MGKVGTEVLVRGLFCVSVEVSGREMRLSVMVCCVRFRFSALNPAFIQTAGSW